MQNMTGEGTFAFMSAFDTDLELNVGRVAMMGFAGLLVNEIFIKQGAFF